MRKIVILFILCLCIGNTTLASESNINLIEEKFEWEENEFSIMSNSRDFSFFIRWSVQSSEFEITNTSVTVSGFAEVVDQWGLPVSGYDNHQYEIILRETSFHWRSRTVELTTGQFRETIELPSTGNYKIEIVNKDYLPSNYSLSGNGSVSW